MPRTTLDIDGPVLRDLKRLQRIEGKSLGRLVSDLLARVLASRGDKDGSPPTLQWNVRRMGARVDLEDKEAVRAALDEEHDGR